jgi:isoleucyl-tRNA synthetase
MSDIHKPTTQDSNPHSTAPNFNELELGILEFWKENKIFEKSLEQTKAGEPFIFYDGPPFATGTPHYGSILPSVIKDAIPRYQTMRGRFVRRRWGWDCHGLPIETLVEQKLGISGKKQIEELGVDKFNAACRENVLLYVEEWGKMVDRMARWTEFENSYKTMDTTYQESVWWALKQIWDKDLIYEDNKVLMYCSRCETPVSNFEVAMDNSYKDVTENSVYAKFKLKPGQKLGDFTTDKQTFALAWTTTPWTLPGNTALNIGPGITYVVAAQGGNHYILAKDRLEVLEGEDLGDFQVKQELPAQALDGLTYEPLYPGVIDNPDNTAHKIYVEDYVTVEDGTGIVHNAAMYGEVDYEAAKRRNLPRQQMLDQKGEFMAGGSGSNIPASLQGQFFKEADPIVLQELQEKNLVYKVAPFTHSYPHCWRCGTPLYYSALPAWFINIQKIKRELLENNETINWYPEHLKHGRFQKGIENAPDWNITRNRYWATALPFWKCDSENCDGKVCIGSLEELQEAATNFAEVYPNFDKANLEAIDLHKPYIDQVKLKCEQCGGQMSRIPEVIDCWVESGSMPFAELHAPFENNDLFKQRFPSDFVVEYIPQTRAWFYVMHVISTVLFGKAPFKNVMTTGTILAEDGSKMSKSKNNYTDPMETVAQFGADPLRFYFLTSPVIGGEDLNFSEKGVAEVNRKLSMILWNVWSFYRMYAKGTVPDAGRSGSAGGSAGGGAGGGAGGAGSSAQGQHVLDRWVLSRLSATHATVTKALDSYNTPLAGRALQDFVTELSTWYVRRSRDRIKAGGAGAQQALATLGYVLIELCKLLAPFMPFLAEHFYKDLTGKLSVHLEQWSEVSTGDQNLEQAMQNLQTIVETALRIRKENNLRVRQPLAELQFTAETGAMDAELQQIIAEELNVKKVSQVSSLPAGQGWLSLNNLVALDTRLTPELQKEGLARELARQVQDLRKKSSLKIGELVDLYFTTQDENLAEVATNLLDRKKTFINQVKTSLEVEADFETQATVDGKPIWLGLVKV